MYFWRFFHFTPEILGVIFPGDKQRGDLLLVSVAKEGRQMAVRACGTDLSDYPSEHPESPAAVILARYKAGRLPVTAKAKPIVLPEDIARRHREFRALASYYRSHGMTAKAAQIEALHPEPGDALYRSLWIENFDDAAARAFGERFNALANDGSGEDVLLVVNSDGGFVDSLSPIRDTIKSAPVDVRTVAFGRALSAGAFLLAAGTKGKRFALPNSQIMVHEVFGIMGGHASEIAARAKRLSELNERLFHNLAEDIGLPFETFMDSFRAVVTEGDRDVYYSPGDAVTVGIIDAIVPDLATVVPKAKGV
jgi:ATP-dependent Clp protease, protease subunit